MDNKAFGSKGKVCVTGASGFLASWLIKRLLQAGYHVIGTVRDSGNERKVGHLWELEGAKERLELVEADLTKEGSFDKAFIGCEGVFHMASPVVAVKSDPKTEILDPSVQGTLNVLKSCKKNPTIRRVVLTSSSSAVRVREDAYQEKEMDETCWSSVELCEKFQIWYPLAKVLSEKAAWEFAAENNIDLVTVIPSFAVGPSLPRDLSLTILDVLGLFKGKTEGSHSWNGRMGYVHIDDVACCHILVYENADAKGRYICSSSVINDHELASLLAKRYPSFPIPSLFKEQNRKLNYKFDTSKMENLGFKFRGIEEMFDNCVQSFKEQGYLTEN